MSIKKTATVKTAKKISNTPKAEVKVQTTTKAEKLPTIDSVTSEALAAIRKLTAPEQNSVINRLVREMAIERKKAYDSARNDFDSSADNLKSFINYNPAAEKMLAELEEANNAMHQLSRA